jgi:hypothetical protein
MKVEIKTFHSDTSEIIIGPLLILFYVHCWHLDLMSSFQTSLVSIIHSTAQIEVRMASMIPGIPVL